jgi:hypothetical protein
VVSVTSSSRSNISTKVAKSQRYTPSNYSVASNPWAPGTTVVERPGTAKGMGKMI